MIEGRNVPLGFLEDEVYKQISTGFEPGDIFLFYSDGITEIKSESDEFFGEQRLINCVEANYQLTPEALIDTIRETIIAFCGSETFYDDLTCIAIKIHEQNKVLPLLHKEIKIQAAYNELLKVRRFVNSLCKEEVVPAIDDESIWQLETAVHETAANIIKHAYQGETEQLIRIGIDVFLGRIVIKLSHHGTSFDPESAPLPSLDGSQSSGYGLFMTNNAVDEVTYCQGEDGLRCICLVKYCFVG